MKKNLNILKSLKIKTGLSLAFLVALGFLIIATLSFYLEEENLKQTHQIRGQILCNLFAKQVSYGRRIADDLILLAYTQALKEQEDVVSAFVLDEEARILVHTDSQMIGHPSEDPLSKRALEAERAELIIQEDRDLYQFALPIGEYKERIGVVRLNLSKKSLALLFSRGRRTIRLISLVLVFLFLPGGIYLIHIWITKPIYLLKKRIHAGWEKNENLKYPLEIEKLAGAIDHLMAEIREKEQDYQAASQAQLDFIQRLIKKTLEIITEGRGGIITDAYQNIIYATQGIEKVLGQTSEAIENKHLPEIIGDPYLLELLKKAMEEKGEIVGGTLTLANKEIKVALVIMESTDSKLSYTIMILFKK